MTVRRDNRAGHRTSWFRPADPAAGPLRGFQTLSSGPRISRGAVLMPAALPTVRADVGYVHEMAEALQEKTASPFCRSNSE